MQWLSSTATSKKRNKEGNYGTLISFFIFIIFMHDCQANTFKDIEITAFVGVVPCSFCDILYLFK